MVAVSQFVYWLHKYRHCESFAVLRINSAKQSGGPDIPVWPLLTPIYRGPTVWDCFVAAAPRNDKCGCWESHYAGSYRYRGIAG